MLLLLTMILTVWGADFSGSHDYQAQVVVDDLRNPWGADVAPNGDIYITEKSGSIAIVRNNQVVRRLSGIPRDLAVVGQGGLLDIQFHPNFQSNQYVYISYTTRRNARPAGGVNTRVSRFQLVNSRLRSEKVLIQGAYGDDGAHFGCRLAFDSQGYLFATFGERHNKELAQDLKFLNGKTVRIKDDGSIPRDNPFYQMAQQNPEIRAEIFTYGHRNPQGLDIHPIAQVPFVSEHGPSGYDARLPRFGRVGKADEVNHLLSGRNYGWPVLFGDPNILPWTQAMFRFQEEQNTVAPLREFTDPDGIAPSGARFYTGGKFPKWKNSFMVAALRGYIVRLKFSSNGQVEEEETLIPSGFSRIRDVFTGPDGQLMALASGGDLIEILPLGELGDTPTDDDGEDGTTEDPALTEIQKSVAQLLSQKRCTQCHQELKDVTNPPARWVGTVARTSRLYRSVRNETMPLNGRPLSAAEKNLVLAWLEELISR